jgi:N-acetylmuramoyl-L-alanine amidase/FlgD Ig-like domain
MKVLFAAAFALLAAPGVAYAGGPRLVTEEVPLRGERELASVRPGVFHLVGVHWQGAGSVSFRTRSTAGRWGAWRPALPQPLDVPDAGTPESASALEWKLGSPYWVGAANAIQYRLRGAVERLRAHFVRSPAKAIPLRTTAIARSPPLTTRAVWGANEQIRRGAPTYAAALRFAVVHHTAGSNTYTAAQSAAIVRAIQLYHVRGNGWNDIGYNFLVDKYGQVFEGRFGGVERNVVGAHAEGFNTGSVGVALLGTYGDTRPTAAALDAVANVLAWRLDVGHVDPLARLSWISGGNARFPSGTPVPLAAISGHRDSGSTSCPGNALYRQLTTIARKAAEIGLPKLYEPTVVGRPGELVHFSARLSGPVPWTVTVTDSTGSRVAGGQGDGPVVDWTWDATAAAPGRYSYAIEAGPDVRPATGVIGQQATTLTLTGAQARPTTFTPNGDSRADSTAIAYTLSLPATVTATLRDSFGTTLATLFVEEKRAGRHTFRFTASGVPDGRYTIVVVARAPTGREVRVEIPIVVDRTLAAFAAMPAAFSPNGDRRNDELALTFVLATPVDARVRIVRGSRTVATVFDGPLAAGPQRLTWSGRVAEGAYAAVVEATGPFGTRAQTARFTVDVTKPRVRLLSARLMRFSVSEAGTLVVNSNGRATRVPVRKGWVTVPAAAAPQFTAVLWDAAGNRSARVRHP